jgi:hypothetical protein
MAYSILVHIVNEDPIVLDVDELPDPSDQYVFGMNPRYRDGKDVHYILGEVTTILLPWHRITFIELLPSESDEDVVGFVRGD